MTKNMNKFRFLEWDVYKDSKILISLVLGVVRDLPREYRFELGSQVIRSAFSVSLNIAEGSGKTSDRELNRFLDIALGSAYETLAAIDILKENNLVKDAQYKEVYNKVYSMCNQLGGFKKKVVGR